MASIGPRAVHYGVSTVPGVALEDPYLPVLRLRSDTSHGALAAVMVL